MGSQLQAYSKVMHSCSAAALIIAHRMGCLLFFAVFSIFLQSQTEDGIRKELLALQEDKHNYETTTKETLRRVLQEKIEVVRKLAEVEVGCILLLNAQCKSVVQTRSRPSLDCRPAALSQQHRGRVHPPEGDV